MTTIDIFHSDDSLFATIKPDDNSNQAKKVMGDNTLNIAFDDNRYLQFKINDYCIVYGEKYSLSALPIVTKSSKFLYKYALTMHAEGYDLSKAQYLFLGSDNSLREAEFSLMGNADDFMNLVISNANRVGSGWVKGQVIPSDYKNLTFSRENCYNVLSRLADEFDTEFAIEGKTVHLVKRTRDTGFTFKHGRNKGLYDITRQNLNDSSIVTRLYAYGSEKNLPSSYITNGKRLRFPGGYNPCLISNLTATLVDNGDGTQTFGFNYTIPLSPGLTDVSIEWRLTGTNDPWQYEIIGMPPLPRFLTLPNGNYEFRFRTYGITCMLSPGYGTPTDVVVITAPIVVPVFVYTPLPYIERNVALYGVIEETEFFEDIFPHRTGVVSSVNIANEHEFSDAAIDFNVNTQLLPGLTAKVTFNTGQLAGYTFDLQSFDNTTKKFIIQQNADERILVVPSALLRPAIGDTYVLTDIEMPTQYVTAAENELLAAANARLVELATPQLSYNVSLDPAFARRFSRMLFTSDLVWIVDAELEVQRKIRVVSTTRNLVNEYQIVVELADLVSPGTISRIIAAQSSTDRDVRDINSQLLNNSILNNNVVGTLVFQNLPTTNTDTGFHELRIEDASGKLYKRV